MEADEPQFFEELAKLPVVRESYESVWNSFEQIKHKNCLLLTTMGLTQFTIRVSLKAARPALYKAFQQNFDNLNKFSCGTLRLAEQLFPVLREPVQEVVKYGRNKCREGWVYTEPLVRPVTSGVAMVQDSTIVKCVYGAFSLASIGFKIGTFPVWASYRVGMYCTKLYVRTAVCVVKGVIKYSLIALISMIPNCAWHQIHRMLCHLCVHPLQPEQERPCGKSRIEMLETVGREFQRRLVAKVEDVLVQSLGLMCTVLTHLLDVTSAGILLTIKGIKNMSFGSYCVIKITINKIWDWCSQHLADRIPESLRYITTPSIRVATLFKVLICFLGELLSNPTCAISSRLVSFSQATLDFIDWCKTFFSYYHQRYTTVPELVYNLSYDFMGSMLELLMAAVGHIFGDDD